MELYHTLELVRNRLPVTDREFPEANGRGERGMEEDGRGGKKIVERGRGRYRK